MKLIKIILLWVFVIICFHIPLWFWFIALVDVPRILADGYIRLPVAVLFGAAGILGLVSVLSASIGKYKLLFNRRITLTLIIFGVIAILIIGVDLILPFYVWKLYSSLPVILVYVPLVCTAFLVFYFRGLLFSE